MITKPSSALLGFLCFILLAFAGIKPALAKRIALVIGNGQYENQKTLPNPVKDAELIASVLKNDSKFDDVALRTNLRRREMSQEFAALVGKSQGRRCCGGVLLWAWSGKGKRELLDTN